MMSYNKAFVAENKLILRIFRVPCRLMFDSKVHYRLPRIFHDEIKIFVEPQNKISCHETLLCSTIIVQNFEGHKCISRMQQI